MNAHGSWSESGVVTGKPEGEGVMHQSWYEVSMLKGDSAFKKEVYWNHLTSFITITIPGSENPFMFS